MSKNGHARLGPSSAHRWTLCPASIALCQSLPERPSGFAAAAGALMHVVFERRLLSGTGFTAQELSEMAAFGFNAERVRLIVEQAVEATHQLHILYGLKHLATELLVYPGHRLNRTDYWGTADLIAVNPDSRTLLVGDLKTGRGPVDPQDNLQLLSYALGALDVIDFEPERVVLAIVQPPLHGDRALVWETDHAVLLEFQDFIAERAAATDDPNAPPTPSEAACQWCPARPICPAHQKKGGAR
jgi:hypothetical protein